MGLYGGKYAYPEDERELQMVKESYSNLSVYRHPLEHLLTTHYHYKIYHLKGHCVLDPDRYPNRDYVIATYEKSFGLVVGKSYHDCGFGKFWYSRPEKSWGLSKDKLVSKG